MKKQIIYTVILILLLVLAATVMQWGIAKGQVYLKPDSTVIYRLDSMLTVIHHLNKRIDTMQYRINLILINQRK